MSARKQDVRRLADASAPERRNWLQQAAYFHDEDLRYLKFLIPPGARVLELGCGTGKAEPCRPRAARAIPSCRGAGTSDFEPNRI
jgi:hypothetical protein